MKNSLRMAVGIVLVAAGANAELLAKDTRSVRVDYLYDDEALGDSAHGAELGFGVALYDLDDVAIFVSHVENGDMEMQTLGLSIEENWPIAGLHGLMPWAGAGAGYGWLDVSGDGIGANDVDKGGWFARVEGGLKLVMCDYFAFNASARLHYSTHEIYAAEDELEDTNWDFALGVRFYY
jgi:hypothetical protein